MLETVFLRVRQDKVEILKDWMKELRHRENEVLEAFRNEGSRHEAAYLLEDAAGPVLVYVQESAEPEKAHQAFRESSCRLTWNTAR